MEIPKIIAKRYELGKLIGTGGMSKVYTGKDLRLNRTVAIKILSSNNAKEEGFKLRFEKEAQAIARLNTQSVVAIYDTGEELILDEHSGEYNPTPYIVMEYVEGHTLQEILKQDSILPVDNALKITNGILSALEYAHNSNLVHRDIKPANIMITTTGMIKVMDFGIARALGEDTASLTQVNSVVGTAKYISPEQARGEDADGRCDIYATACILYEMLTGRPPFLGDNAIAIAYQHAKQAPIPPAEINSKIPVSLSNIVLKGLKKNPNDRYSSATEFKNALRDFANFPGQLTQQETTQIISDNPLITAPTQLQRVITAEEVDQMFSEEPITRANIREKQQSGDSQNNNSSVLPKKSNTKLTTQKRIITVMICLIVLLIIIGAIFAIFNKNSSGKSNFVEVPTIQSKMTASEAKTTLSNLGFIAVEKDVNDDSVPEGEVVKFSPESGTKIDISIDNNNTVTYFVSKGSKQFSVPDISGMTQDQARSALETAGLSIGSVLQKDSPTIQQDKVVSSDPKIGAEVKKGDSVTIYLSSGQTKVPKLIGLSLKDAQDKISKSGLVLAGTSTQDSNKPKDQVLTQSLASGTQVKQGSAITIVTSTGNAQITLPDFSGQIKSQVDSWLASQGLKAKWASEYSDSVPSGTVVRSDPQSGKTVNKGATVTIYLSLGSQPTPDPDAS